MPKQPIQFLKLESQMVSLVMKNGRKLKSVFLFAGGHDSFSLPPWIQSQHAHLLSVLTAWSELQRHGDYDGISLAESKQTAYYYQVSLFILRPTAMWT